MGNGYSYRDSRKYGEYLTQIKHLETILDGTNERNVGLLALTEKLKQKIDRLDKESSKPNPDYELIERISTTIARLENTLYRAGVIHTR